MIRYINIKSDFGVETVDELEVNNLADRKELKRLLNEYNLSDSYNHYYISQRCCKGWND